MKKKYFYLERNDGKYNFCMSKKSLPILQCELLFKTSQDFLESISPQLVCLGIKLSLVGSHAFSRSYKTYVT